MAQRYASTALALPEDLTKYALKDPKIPAGTKALQLPVPSSLPETDFNMRRQAVEDHAYGA